MAASAATTQPVAYPLLDSQFYIESSRGVLNNPDTTVSAALFPAMVRTKPLEVLGGVSVRLLANLPQIQSILACFVRGQASVIPVIAQSGERTPLSGDTSLFFSGGVDSVYSLLVNHSAIQNLLLVHGFDVFIHQAEEFKACEQSAHRVASLFDKKLVVVHTDLRALPGVPPSWVFWHGGALAAVAHALSHLHRTVIVSSTYPWEDLHPWGSHPQLDPLWSSEAVEIFHHGTEARRTDKIGVICRSPELLPELRVCWEHVGKFNCGRCEKCVRTMVALAAFGGLERARFASPLTPAAIRSLRLDHGSQFFWRELLLLDLPTRYRAAASHILANFRWDLPPRTGTLKGDLPRLLAFLRRIAELGRHFFS